jgi:hypothetical protein
MCWRIAPTCAWVADSSPEKTLGEQQRAVTVRNAGLMVNYGYFMKIKIKFT